MTSARMSAWCRSCAAVCLLAVLCVTGGCAATQQQQQQQQPSAVSSTNTDVALEFVSRAVVVELRPLLRKLESRIEALDGGLDQLNSRVDDLQARLFEICQNPRLGDLFDRLDNHQSQLNKVVAKLDKQHLQLDEVISQSNNHQSQLDGIAIKVNNQITLLKNLTTPKPRDCSELPARSPTGVYLLWPGPGRTESAVSFCDMETDGGNWTVFQRRDEVHGPHQDFYLEWTSYKLGFGNLTKEFWWGLEHLRTMMLAKDRQYELRIDLEDFDGNKRYALYQGFRISAEEDGYRMSVSNYTGDAGDSLTDGSRGRFGTRDSHYGSSCAQGCRGGWWYGDCGDSSLNGRYLDGGAESGTGIWWRTWKGYESLKKTEMKVRPVF